MSNRMKVSAVLAGMLCGLSIACSSAHSACEQIPDVVSRYLDANADVSLVMPFDLSEDDQALWKQYHDDRCPGLAVADLNGQGPSYGLALIKKLGAGIYRERFVILLRTPRGITAHTVVQDRKVTIPFVVWSAPPGKSYDYRVGRDVWIKRDSIVYEEMESVATQYFIEDGQLKSLIAAD